MNKEQIIERELKDINEVYEGLFDDDTLDDLCDCMNNVYIQAYEQGKQAGSKETRNEIIKIVQEHIIMKYQGQLDYILEDLIKEIKQSPNKSGGLSESINTSLDLDKLSAKQVQTGSDNNSQQTKPITEPTEIGKEFGVRTDRASSSIVRHKTADKLKQGEQRK